MPVPKPSRMMTLSKVKEKVAEALPVSQLPVGVTRRKYSIGAKARKVAVVEARA